MTNLRTILIAFSIAVVPACADDAGDPGPQGPVTLEIGTGIDDTYAALEHGSRCKIRYATQGGYWAMYRVRAYNVPDGAQLDCGVWVGESRVLVGERVTVMRTSGDVSYGQFQIPVLADESDRVGALAGQSGEIFCYYEDQLFSTDVVIDVTYPDDDRRKHYDSLFRHETRHF